MIESRFTAADGQVVQLYRVDPAGEPRAVVHIAHGMGEHAARYEWTMEKLADAGFVVYANDHRAHGLTAAKLGDFGPDGVNATINDLRELIASEKAEHPGLPCFLFGHSMGAMLSQMFITRHGEMLDGVILSGTPGTGSGLQLWLSHQIARFERWRTGGLNHSNLLQNLLFGASNKAFDDEPGSTGFEWLSRDPVEVRKYLDDPRCGFVPCPRSLCDLFEAERNNWRKDSIDSIPRALPVYLFVGTDDPVHAEMKNVLRLLGHYRKRSINVSTRYYQDGRHEMLNEINRDEVIQDVINWLEAQLHPA